MVSIKIIESINMIYPKLYKKPIIHIFVSKQNNTIKVSVLMIIVLLCMMSCGNNNNEIIGEIKQLSGQHVVFPSGYRIYYSDSSDISTNKCAKIITYIDDIPCTTCEINALHTIVNEMSKLTPNIPYLIVVHTRENNDEVLYMLDSIMYLPTPLIYYSSDTFKIANHLDVHAVNRTFMVDDNNRIIVVGEPWHNKKLKELYKKAAKALISNKNSKHKQNKQIML